MKHLKLKHCSMLIMIATALTVLAASSSALAQLAPGSPVGDLIIQADPSGEINLGKFGSPYVVCFFIPGDAAAAEEIKALQTIIAKNKKLKKFKIIMATRGKDDNEREMSRSFIKKHGLKAALAFEPDTAAARAFSAFQFPSFFIVDSRGILRTTRVPSVTQPIRKRSMESLLEIVADGDEIPMIDLLQESSASKEQLNLIGKSAPDFTLKDIAGSKTYKLSSMKGKNVVVVFWNEGCPHCRAELPLINDFYSKNKNKYNFEVLAISRKGDAGSAKRTSEFVAEKKFLYPVLFDLDEPVSNQYLIKYIPTAYFINSDGIIVDLTVGTPAYFETSFESIFTDPLRLGAKKKK